jgi:RHS repeat-associated protein
VRRLVNVASSSDVPCKGDYSAFGVVTGTGLDVVPFGFAGGMYDADTGLVRFGARDYDAQIGRWVSKDPILFEGGQANVFVYAGNDPVNATDASGTGPLDIIACLSGGATLAECLQDERRRLCTNWGIGCPGSSPPNPGGPSTPAGPGAPPNVVNKCWLLRVTKELCLYNCPLGLFAQQRTLVQHPVCGTDTTPDNYNDCPRQIDAP